MKAASPSASTRSSPVTKHQIEVITSVERRRRWSREDKERLVAATFEPGASVSDTARSAGIHVSQLFRWRKELCQISAPSVPQLVAVEVVEALPAAIASAATADLQTAQEEQHGVDRAWRRPPPAGRE
ncbi:MAG: transposase [Mesorhizobium sp.]|nr:MAG: transposase [Mesorhizobium sp.]